MRRIKVFFTILLLGSTIVIPNTFAQDEPRTVINVPQWSGYDISIHPDRKIIASASLLKVIHLFDIETAEEIKVLAGHEKGVETVGYSPKGNILVSGDQSGFNFIWDTKTNLHIKTLDKHTSAIKDIVFTRDGKILATGSWGWGETLRLWNPETGELLHGMESGVVDDVAFSFDESVVASGSLHTGLIHIWDTDTGDLLHELETGMEHVLALEFWGKERMLVCGGTDGLQLWDAEKGVRINTFLKIGGDNEVRTIAINPDRRLLASGRNDGLVHLWDLKTLKIVETIDWHFSRLNTVAFSTDGLTLATVAGENEIGVWDVEPLEDIVFNVSPHDKVSVLWGDLKQR